MRNTHIDHPLESSKGTDHDDSHRQAVPEAAEANVLVYPADGTTEGLSWCAVGVELADHDIGRMRYDGAKDTSQVASGEGHSGLSSLAIVRLLTRQAVIDHLDNGLEGGKLHHGIGDLATPQRIQTLVQTGGALLGRDGADAVEGAGVGVGNGALHTDLDSLKGAEGDVGKELGRGRGSEVQTRLVLVSGLRAGQVRVCLLEVFIPAVLESSLGRVSKEGGTPAGEDAADALGAVDLAPGLKVARVELGVDLATGLDEIKGSDGSMSEALK